MLWGAASGLKVTSCVLITQHPWPLEGNTVEWAHYCHLAGHQSLPGPKWRVVLRGDGMERNQRVGCDFFHNAIQAWIIKFCFEFHKQQTQNNTLSNMGSSPQNTSFSHFAEMTICYIACDTYKFEKKNHISGLIWTVIAVCNEFDDGGVVSQSQGMQHGPEHTALRSSGFEHYSRRRCDYQAEQSGQFLFLEK